MIPLKRSQLWKQVVKLSNVLCGIMKNYDLSLKGKGVSFFLTTLLDFNNSLPDILIYLFANIHSSSIDPVIKHLTRVTWNKVCKKLIIFFVLSCSYLAPLTLMFTHKIHFSCWKGRTSASFLFCDCEYFYGSAWKWLLYSDYVLLRPSLFDVFPHLF